MSERKLKGQKLSRGYELAKLADLGLPLSGLVLVIRANDGAWWPWNMAPEECFEAEPVTPRA